MPRLVPPRGRCKTQDFLLCVSPWENTDLCKSKWSYNMEKSRRLLNLRPRVPKTQLHACNYWMLVVRLFLDFGFLRTKHSSPWLHSSLLVSLVTKRKEGKERGGGGGGEVRKSRKEGKEREGKEREEKTIISILWKYLQKEQYIPPMTLKSKNQRTSNVERSLDKI